MTSRVSPFKPPKGPKRSESLASIHYNDEAVEVEGVGSTPVELDEETKWIRSHIKRRECKWFTATNKHKDIVPSPYVVQSPSKDENFTFVGQNNTGTEDPECQCGFPYSEHSTVAKQGPATGERWDKKTHTVQKMTNAFGEIEFAGYGGNIGKYIRVDVSTKMSDMLELMMNIWGMDKPNLLISVTGGAKNFQMNKRLKETFRRGLMKAAQTTGAWIITGGTHAGVMKHVGEAVKDFGLATSSQNPVVAIGIAPWGCVQNRELLIDDDCKGQWPASYRIEREQKKKESFLDPNHTHFILCDNGTEHKFAVEIPFRAKLENELAKIKTDTGEDAVSVPIVLLVLEGGPGTLETVHQAIQNNTPAVIVKGSGRAADILAHAYIYAKEEEIEAQDSEGKKQKKTVRQMDESLEVEVKNMVEKEFGNKETSVHVGRIKDCLYKSDLMSIFEHDNRTGGSKDIDVAMLKALLKANKNQVMDQLRLALAWNRIDVAKSEIFTDDKRWPTGSLDDVMTSAIQLNRVDFVELFLDHGVSLREFLTCKRLLFLYNKIPQNALLRTLLNKVKNRENPTRRNFSLLDVGMLMQDLIGDYYRPSYRTKQLYAELDADEIMEGQIHNNKGVRAVERSTKVAVTFGANVDHEKLSKKASIAPVVARDFENPAQELFLWCVLAIRQDMAKLFWAEGKDAIAAALVGNSLLKAMVDKTEDAELIHKVQECADEWSTLSIGVLSECYATDDQRAQDLLVRELVHWGEATCMLIAVKADNKDFISQTACQSLLNSIWMGKMMQENGTWRLITCIFCPPLAVWLIKYNFDEVYIPVDTRQKIELREDGKDGKPALKRQGTFLRSTSGDDYLRKKPTLKRQGTAVLSTDLKHSRTSLQGQEDVDGNSEDTPVVMKHVHGVRKKVYAFFTAPVIIFLYNVVSYIVFLLLFSYILIVDLNPTVSPAEILLMIWVFTIFTEEIRQVVSTSSNSLGTKLLSYISDTWNVVDIITIVLFIIGMVLRFIPTSETFEVGRVFLALNFVSFFLRLLHIFSVHKELGPKLVMIGRMIRDLMYFVVILMVFVISYAIASHSILFPNSPLNGDTVIALIRRSYWNIYGELFLDEIEGDPSCTFDDALWKNNTYPRCPTDIGRYVVPIMMGVYMLLANVLLLNLLIAMFSYTFQLVQDNTDKHWFYQRYSLIYEYYTRPVLCPPFIFLSHIYLFFKFVMSCCCQCCGTKTDEDDDFRRKFSNERELIQWENIIADAFHHKTEMKAFDKMEYKVDTTSIRLDLLINRMDEIQEQQQTLTASAPAPSGPSAQLEPQTPVSPSSVVVKMPAQLDLRLTSLERQMEKTAESLNWIVKAMIQEQMGTDKAPPVFKSKEQRQREEEEKARKRADKEREIVEDMIEEREEVHYRSRQSPYPGTQIIRFPVADSQVPWRVKYPEYSPVAYTSPEVLQRPEWSDVDLMNMSMQGRSLEKITYNAFDPVSNIDRTSFMGRYEVKDGIPVNPKGRTGLVGRGSLGHWGPNKAVDPVVTRWKMVNGEVKKKHGKPVLEFAAVMRSDNQMWSLPGGILMPGAQPLDHLKAEFTQEALGNLQGEQNAKLIENKLGKLWQKFDKIYEGYADDPRNTDNAWLETSVCNYHDGDGNILQHFNLRAGETVDLASWMTVSSKITLHGSHAYFLKLTAEKLGAYF